MLAKSLPDLRLEPGDVGFVVRVNKNSQAYEVGFMTLEDDTIGVATLELADVRPAGHAEVPRVRERLV
ncbi:protein of unknown function [Collimonas sp. OK607]|uniref:DUF4926 domain-containing protein n=1 Tax=Collimonas sp. OK607 TaxID=1798194 RepID=UPI0008E51FFA|nr:DUF4926 domain-containing protein [Collimonas sp. OK607]SFB42141.1 protein of unknown function [Collimonas sp. OK607]